MNTREAAALIAGAVPHRPGIWADLGAGEGTFTRALAARLGPGSRIYAVDKRARVIASVRRRAAQSAVDVIPVEADFTQGLELPDLPPNGLDGLLLANSLHYVAEPGPLLAGLVRRVHAGGRIVIVEYDGRPANPWVPYPIPSASLMRLAAETGLTPPVVSARRASVFGGTLYVAHADRA